MTPGVELIVVMLAFLGLLTVGMTIPFAILVPSVLYLVMHAGLAGLKGIGPVSWGSMNSFTLTAIPLFILMAEILQESKLSQRVYRGLSTLVAWMPGGLLQTNIAGRRRDARDSVSAEHRDDRLRHVHRNLGGETVHGRGHAGIAADLHVHELHRRACLAETRRGAGRTRRALACGIADRRSRCAAVCDPDRRHDGKHLFGAGHADGSGGGRMPAGHGDRHDLR